MQAGLPVLDNPKGDKNQWKGSSKLDGVAMIILIFVGANSFAQVLSE
jgi:hypothetical protein